MEKLEAQLRDNDQRKASLGSHGLDESQFSAGQEGRRESRLRKLTGWYIGAEDEGDKPFEPNSPIDLKPGMSYDISMSAAGLFATLLDEGPGVSDE